MWARYRGRGGIGNINNRSPVLLLLAGERIKLHASVVADVSDPAVPLFLDDGLVRAAGLQVVVADQIHVAASGRLLGYGARSDQNRERRQNSLAKHCAVSILLQKSDFKLGRRMPRTVPKY